MKCPVHDDCGFDDHCIIKDKINKTDVCIGYINRVSLTKYKEKIN